MIFSRVSRRAVRAAIGVGLPIGVAAVLGCVPLPLRLTPAVTGQVVDAASGQPVAGALVVVRYDARYDELLPDRDLIGHREIATDAAGRFRVPTGARSGLTAWPHSRTEARVVGVMREGYRCARPVGAEGPVTLRLEPARDEEDRRSSCRPVASKPDETPGYHAAWRALYPRESSAAEREMQRELDRVLEARAAFGFGENCSGPAVDLALSPGGERAAVAVLERDGRRIEVVDLTAGARRIESFGDPSPGDARRLAWNASEELVLWEPASVLERSTSVSRISATSGGPQRVWRAAQPPASRDEGGRAPLQPADLNDEGESRWLGRSFRLERQVDPETGLGQERLRVTSSDGEAYEIPLPGETCGPAGQYGRPHFRIDAGGERGLDLRYVDGGCRAVAIDLRDGRWTRLDSSRAAGRCATARRVPLDLFRRAMRGYAEEVENALTAADGDAGSAFVLKLGGPAVELHAQNYLGEPLKLVVGPLPVHTPLRRIEITSVAGAGIPVPEGAAPRTEPAPDRPRLEPL